MDYLALIGDASDNIPGVEGVGPKTAAKLISEHGSLDAILANPEIVQRESLREKISAAKDILALNRKLITLNFEAPLDQASFDKAAPDYGQIRALAERFELKSILKELDKIHPAAVPEKTPEQASQLEFQF